MTSDIIRKYGAASYITDSYTYMFVTTVKTHVRYRVYSFFHICPICFRLCKCIFPVCCVSETDCLFLSASSFTAIEPVRLFSQLCYPQKKSGLIKMSYIFNMVHFWYVLSICQRAPSATLICLNGI